MRACRRRRIQDYQLRSTADPSDTKPVADSIVVPDTQVDGFTNVSILFCSYVYSP